MGIWVNLLGYQCTWFIAVIGARHGTSWPAWTAASLLCTGHLLTSEQRWLDVRLGLLATLLGALLDGLLASTGLLHYSPAQPTVPPIGCPLWILALWMAFSTTLTRSLGWLRGRMRTAVLFGMAGGPLAYWAAGRGWGVVVLSAPAWKSVLVLGVGWGIALGVLVGVATVASASPTLARSLPPRTPEVRSQSIETRAAMQTDPAPVRSPPRHPRAGLQIGGRPAKSGRFPDE